MFVDGFSCAQSLLAVYGPPLGVEREAALRLAAPLGGGMSRTDGPCGAATGALLVLGLKHGHTHPDDEAGAERIRILTQDFLRRYDERKGSTMCTDILGHNLSLPGVAEQVKAGGLSKEPCPRAVRAAAVILESLLQGELP
jgi:C_GCAxxG_C_C family probable redox protein